MASLLHERRLHAVVAERATPDWLRPGSRANVLGESAEGDALYQAHAPCERLAEVSKLNKVPLPNTAGSQSARKKGAGDERESTSRKRVRKSTLDFGRSSPFLYLTSERVRITDWVCEKRRCEPLAPLFGTRF